MGTAKLARVRERQWYNRKHIYLRQTGRGLQPRSRSGVITRDRNPPKTATTLVCTAPSMSDRRRNTIFDLTDLRLHPDGTRIFQSSQASSHSLTAAEYRRNQIAQDASSWGKVHKFRKRKVPQEEIEGEFTNQELDLDTPSTTGAGAGKATHQGQSKSKGPDKKTVKRRRVVDDYDFLGNEHSERTQKNTDTVSASLPSPVRHLSFISNRLQNVVFFF